MSVFQIRDFRFLWGSTVLGNTCLFMDIVVLGLLVLDRTDSPFWLALVGALRFLPWLLFGVFAGLIADRANRYRVMVVARSTNVVAIAIVLLLVATDWVQPWHTLLTSLALGWALVLDQPSRHSFILDLVGSRNLIRAMSLDSITFTIGTIIGPLLAGLFIEVTGFTGAYIFLLSIYVLSLIGMSQIRSRVFSAAKASQPILQNLVSGIRYALQNRIVRSILIVTLIMNLVVFGAVPLFPAVARDHLHVGPGLTGVLISAFGIGTLVGTAIVVYMGSTKYHGRIFVLGGSLALLSLLLFALSPWYSLSFLMLLMLGLGSSGFFTMQSTTILLSTSQEKRGMALGVLSLCIGVGPIGIMAIGGVATQLTPPVAISIGSAVGLLLMLPVVILSPLMGRTTAVFTEGATSPEETSSDDHIPQLPIENTDEGTPRVPDGV